MSKEIWKYIAGYEGLYQVSNFGRVKSLNYARQHVEKVKKLQTKPNGYVKVDLRHNGQLRTKHVHRLVAEAFVPNPRGRTEVNHIDGNKLNNTSDNLEWCNRSENMAHCKNVLHKVAGRAPTPVECIETGIIYPDQHFASRATGIPMTSINGMLKGRLKHAGGYHWKYI